MGASERAFVAQPIPAAGGRIIASPFQFYTTGEDRLRVTSVNSADAVALKIQSRFVDTAGTIQANSDPHVPNIDRTAKTTEQELGVGALLNLTVFASAGAPVQGQTFVIVQLIRGTGAAAIVLGTLLQGYVTSTQHLAWPGSVIESSTAGEPFVRTVVGSQPAAGAEHSEVVPTGARWELLMVNIELVDGVAVAVRRPRLVILANAFLVSGRVPVFTTMAANDDFGFCIAPGLPAGSDGAGNFSVPLPTGLILQAGGIIATSTGGLQAADRWQKPILQVREWLEVP